MRDLLDKWDGLAFAHASALEAIAMRCSTGTTTANDADRLRELAAAMRALYNEEVGE